MTTTAARNRCGGCGVIAIVRRLVLVALASTVLFATACARATSPAGSGSATPGASTGTVTTAASSPQPSPADSTTVSVWHLRYLLLGHYVDFAYCDPDFYPVVRDEQSAADGWWLHVNRGSPEVLAVLARRGYREPLAKDQRLAAYRDHKKLTVIAMKAVPGGYEYELSTSASGGEPDQTVDGLVSREGRIDERSRSARPGGCPICLEAGTRIATPHGDVLAADVEPGDVVWTVDGSRRQVAALVVRVVRRATPGPHLMLRLALSDGRVLVAAGAHPAADGTYLRELHTGQRYDGATIVSIGWVQSAAPATYDLLPAGSTGDYWANGILVGSTLN
jgi:hypothetical protein